jgi:hypothetical protein
VHLPRNGIVQDGPFEPSEPLSMMSGYQDPIRYNFIRPLAGYLSSTAVEGIELPHWDKFSATARRIPQAAAYHV